MIYTTFGIPATADSYHAVADRDQLLTLLQQHRTTDTPLFILGGGSNVIFSSHYHGTVIHLENKGIHLIGHDPENGDLHVQAAAGESWDTFVLHCIDNHWHGAENLAAIPGTVGAAPVQNVGAYGTEAKDIIHSVLAIDTVTGQERTFTNDECRFGYRDSIFKSQLKGRYIVWAVTFRLHPRFTPDLRYKGLADALEASGLTRKKLEPVLSQLWKLCFTGAGKDLNIAKENVEKAEFKESADKIRRMYESATANGFTSFAEA